jgi:hypothetical protein
VKVEYRGIVKGYGDYCLKCGIKINQWCGEKGQIRKKHLSESMIDNNFSVGRPLGSKNINSYPQSEKVLNRYKEFPPPSWLGKKHTLKTREKMSETRAKLIKENGGSMAYKGKFNPKNPEKYKGDHKNIVWRSTWEAKYMDWLDRTEAVISWSSEEVVIPYKDPLDGHLRRYFVDFYVQIKDSKGKINTYLIEIKPKYQTVEPVKRSRTTQKYITEVYTYAVNQSKWKKAEEYCMDRGWQFKVLTEDDLGIGNK